MLWPCEKSKGGWRNRLTTPSSRVVSLNIKTESTMNYMVLSLLSSIQVNVPMKQDENATTPEQEDYATTTHNDLHQDSPLQVPPGQHLCPNPESVHKPYLSDSAQKSSQAKQKARWAKNVKEEVMNSLLNLNFELKNMFVNHN